MAGEGNAARRASCRPPVDSVIVGREFEAPSQLAPLRTDVRELYPLARIDSSNKRRAK
jgi:hypothetical protein